MQDEVDDDAPGGEGNPVTPTQSDFGSDSQTFISLDAKPHQPLDHESPQHVFKRIEEKDGIDVLETSEKVS